MTHTGQNKVGNEGVTTPASSDPAVKIELRNRQYTYSEILQMTNNFETVIGKGGFGTVYLGFAGDCQVAVKMLSPSSVQGHREFQAEVSTKTKNQECMYASLKRLLNGWNHGI